jgi:hypothetical protein
MPKTVMIVEDNELNMKLFHDLLEAYGYRTIGTRDGFEVVDLARKRLPFKKTGYGGPCRHDSTSISSTRWISRSI